MAWNTPSVPAAGTLINTTIWTQQIYDNFRYLKGLDGLITLESGILVQQAAAMVNQFKTTVDGAGVYVDMRWTNSANRYTSMAYTSASYSGAFLTGGPSGEQGVVYNAYNVPLVFGVNNTRIGVMTTTGLALGHNTPGNLLHLSSGAGVALRVDGSGNAPLSTSASGGTPAAFYLGSANTYYLANPARWWLVVLDGTTYRIPCYTA